MLIAPLSAVLFVAAQGAGNATPQRPAQLDRLELCLAEARADPATAIAEADTWLADTGGSDATYAQHCLGLAYTALLRWPAAEQAFLAARDAAPMSDTVRRAQLATMAANAALAEERAPEALASLALAEADARASGDAALQSIVAVDRSRALVLQGNEIEAETMLASARELDPQAPYAWLLSATLARRLGKLDAAQGFIETAAGLSPNYPEIGLEAGVIAMLAGREATAAASWRSVVELAPESDEAATARGYLAQLEEAAAGE